jgi:hypothetical protein
MKTIYALVAACLSLQACNSEAPTTSIRLNENSEYSTAVPSRDAEYASVITGPAITSFDDYAFAASAVHLTDQEYVATTSAIPAIKPIDGAEFEGTSRDDAYTPWSDLPTGLMLDGYTNWSMDTDDHTATVTSPSSEAVEDKSVASEPALYFDDDAFGFKLPAPIDQHAIQATDCW